MLINRFFNYYLLILIQVATILSCRREDVAGDNGTGEPIGTRVNSAVTVIDTNAVTNPVRTNGQVRFDIVAAIPEIKKGDLFLYRGKEGIYGIVMQSYQTDSRLTIGLNKTALGAFWPEVLISDTTLSKSYFSSSRMLADDWIGDTLYLANFSFYDGVLQGKRLKVVIPSGKIALSYNLSQKVSGGGTPWFRRFSLSADYNMLLTGKLQIESGGSLDVADSLMIDETSYKSFHSGDIPVYYKVQTWLGYHVRMEKDTVMAIEFNDHEIGNAGFTYNYWSGWSASGESLFSEASVTAGLIPQFSGSSGELFVTQQFIPVFCGEPGISLTNRLSESVGRDVVLPAWNQTAKSTLSSHVESSGLALGEIAAAPGQTQNRIHYQDQQSGLLANQKPKANLNVSPRAGFTNTSFELNATGCTDLESASDMLTVRWDFESDNVFDTDFATSKVVYHVFLQPGTYLTTMEVRDPGGLTDRKSISIEVSIASSAPIAHFTVSPENGRISTLFIFDASGCFDIQDPITQLQVRWDFTGDGEWDTPFSFQKAQGYFFRNPGNFVTKLEVMDSEGLTGSTSRLIKVQDANIKPSPVFKVDPQKGTTETIFSFDASGSTDPEDPADLLRVRWDWNNDGYYDTEYRTLKTIQHKFSDAGTYTIVLEVTDTEGYASTFSKTVVVSNPNTPPNADFTITPTSGTKDTLFEFDASISTDIEDNPDQLEVRWDWDNDNIYDTSFVTEKVFKRSFTIPGTYIIKVQIRDSGGLTDTKARLVIVN